MSQGDLFGDRGATLSDCGRYRYRLWRRWADGPTVLFVMLNPSTADADVDDPTIRRCIGFARSWGAGALEVVNLYAWRATQPAELKAAVGPVGEYPWQPHVRHHINRNDVEIEEAAAAPIASSPPGERGRARSPTGPRASPTSWAPGRSRRSSSPSTARRGTRSTSALTPSPSRSRCCRERPQPPPPQGASHAAATD
jgi:hypothetical protein